MRQLSACVGVSTLRQHTRARRHMRVDTHRGTFASQISVQSSACRRLPRPARPPSSRRSISASLVRHSSIPVAPLGRSPSTSAALAPACAAHARTCGNAPYFYLSADLIACSATAQADSADDTAPPNGARTCTTRSTPALAHEPACARECDCECACAHHLATFKSHARIAPEEHSRARACALSHSAGS